MLKKERIEKELREKASGNKTFKCCYGISSKADDDGGHVLYLDYDSVPYDHVISHLSYIQKEYCLSDIFLIRSTNGFNAVCLDVIPLATAYLIGTEIFSPCDRDFYKYGVNRGYFTLRFDCDKHLKEIVRSDNRRYSRSSAHKKFLEWFFDIAIDDDPLFNGFQKVNIVQFPSDKSGYHIVDKVLPRDMGVMNR